MALQLPKRNKEEKEEARISGITLSSWRNYREATKELLSNTALMKELKDFGLLNFQAKNKNTLITSGGVEMPISQFPTAFKNAISGEYGLGNFSIDDIIFYNEDIAKNIAYAHEEYDEYVGGYNLAIYSLLDKESSFDKELCIPKVGSKTWSKNKKLSNSLSPVLNQKLNEVIDNSKFACSIAKLHMNGKIPVLSFKDRIGSTDYGITEYLLKEYTMSIKQVFFVLSEVKDFKVSDIIAKKHKDGEYTLTIY